ncbi:DUF3781 domain-containing protein [Companilactobacillus keshanensis]|uniref:DUF3781 domain-containing protein n=1 Tax=Companilactobacillus keshanensis TaxID=2486003 RepID=A0ABW4BVN5_9LACO|nr:DUF3781 domain-containing protein [Companilactobacillus keshanensis]
MLKANTKIQYWLLLWKEDKLIDNVTYTELVFARVNKKLNTDLSKSRIKEIVNGILSDENSFIERIGKNYYVRNKKYKIRLTINSSTKRLITVDSIL